MAQHGDVAIAAAAGGPPSWRSRSGGTSPWRSRRQDSSDSSPWTAACFPLFAKTVFDYYLVEPYVFGVVWWLARPGSAVNWRALVPVLLTADVLLSRLGEVVSTDWLIAEGITSSVIIAVVVAMVTVDLWRSPRHGVAEMGFRARRDRPEASVRDNHVL